MTTNEKILLLQLLMMDIRNDWEDDDKVERRLNSAKKTLTEINYSKVFNSTFFNAIENNLNEFKVGYDGRWFRESYTEGGYLGLEDIHNLCHNGSYNDINKLCIANRSFEFAYTCMTELNNPGDFFIDWNEEIPNVIAENRSKKIDSINE